MAARPLRIGIAGPMGAGKSSAARRLIDAGFTVIDADAEAKRLMETSPAVKDALRLAFGDTILIDNRIDFPALAARVFSEEDGLDRLNAVVRTPVAEALAKTVLAASTDTVLDAALIPFWGIEQAFDGCLWIDAPRAIRIERLIERGCPRAEAVARVEGQAGMLLRPDADHWLFIENIGTTTELHAAIDEAIAYFREEACTQED